MDRVKEMKVPYKMDIPGTNLEVIPFNISAGVSTNPTRNDAQSGNPMDAAIKAKMAAGRLK